MVAVGPGDSDMLTLQGRESLLNADLVLGFTTVLNVVRPWLENAEVRPMTYRDQEEALEYAEGQVRKGKRCVVCCWGDLNVSARELLARVRRRADNVKLVPGISSVQVAMARTGISLEDAVFITLHKRADTGGDLDELVHYINEGRRHVIMLPRPFDLMPAGIALGPSGSRSGRGPPGAGLPAPHPGRRDALEGHPSPVQRDRRGVQRPVHHGLSQRGHASRIPSPEGGGLG